MISLKEKQKEYIYLWLLHCLSDIHVSITQDAFDIAVPAVVRTRIIMNLVNFTSLATSLPVAHRLEYPTSVRNVVSSTPLTTQIFPCPTFVIY